MLALHVREGRLRRQQEEKCMDIHFTVNIASLLALVAGILILIRPRLLNYIVAIYLIVVGVLGLVGY
jgi:hypothetical protein